MPEKGLSFGPNQWMSRTGSFLQWRFGMLTSLVCFCCLVVWTLDGCTIKGFLDAWRFQQDYRSFRAFISGDVLVGEGSPSFPQVDSAVRSSQNNVGSSNFTQVSPSNESSVDLQKTSLIDPRLADAEKASSADSRLIDSENASFVGSGLVDSEKANLVDSQIIDSENASSVGLRLVDSEKANLVDSKIIDSKNASSVGSQLVDSEKANLVDSKIIDSKNAISVGSQLVDSEKANLVDSKIIDSKNASSVGSQLVDSEKGNLVDSQIIDSKNASSVGSRLVDSEKANLVDSQNTSFNILAKGSYQKEGENGERSPPDWVSAELGRGYTSNLMLRLMASGGEKCKDGKTEEISIPGLDGKDLIELSVGDAHEFSFTALGPGNAPICLGGDYFEIDLSGDSWKSRPPVKDFGNGSYSTTLQVHPDFAGNYNLTIILLYRHFEGLRFSPIRFVYDRELRKIPVRFHKSEARLPELQLCRGSDFTRDVWTGRWTRHERNDKCKISEDGRFRCLPRNLQCKRPWCDGTLASLESNGWVYSAHCSFRIFPAKTAWNCLKNRWIFFWGDSNHVDTIRNMLNFMLDLPEVEAVPRRFDLNFSNPKDPSQTVRITSIFNGHSNDTKNYEGLDSLKIEEYRILLKKYFSEETVPDTIIMNSGLHDGVHWRSIKYFIRGADYAASFWGEVMESIRRRALTPPKIIYRTTVATGGYARSLGFNPNKMEAFNNVVIDKFKEAGLLSAVIDDFDMTFPWHYDNRCNDGVHYGRRPAKLKWRDGEIGHQYFVDIMLAHILLNALCIR